MSDGIVPPYMSPTWQALRRHLALAALAATAGSEASTTEEVKSAIGQANNHIRTAEFLRHRLEREEPRDDDDH